MKYKCPHDLMPLVDVREAVGVVWYCLRCDGKAITRDVLRQIYPHAQAEDAWKQALRDQGSPGHPCPGCGAPTAKVLSLGGDKPLLAHICITCEVCWLDAPNREDPPDVPDHAIVSEVRVPEEERLYLARQRIEEIRRQYQPKTPKSKETITWWKMMLMALGMPVETGGEDHWIFPWATYSAILLATALSLLALYTSEAFALAMAFYPGQPLRFGGINYLTVFFVHGSIYHLLGNMYFLFLLGRNVEARLGIGWFLLLLGLSTVAGNLAHFLGDPRSDIPLVGASGGISGVIAFYALAFPRNKFAILFWWRTVSMPAWVMAILWAGLQVLGAFWQVLGFSNVSSFAHIGGAVTGVAGWAVWRYVLKRDPGRPVKSIRENSLSR